MKFEVVHTSDMFDDESYDIEIETLEDLIKFQKEKKHPIIILGDERLEIYDDYRE